MTFNKIKHAATVFCAVVLMVVVLVNTGSAEGIVRKGPGKGEQIQSIEQFWAFLSCISGSMDVEGVSLENAIKHKLLSVPNVLPNGLGDGEDDTNENNVSKNQRYTSWTVKTNVCSSISSNDASAYVKATMEMGIAEGARHFCIENAFVNISSNSQTYQIEYDAEIFVMGDVLLVKYDKYKGSSSLDVEISDGFFGKWFYASSFDEYWAEQLLSILNLGLDAFFDVIEDTIEDSMEDGTVVHNGRKYDMQISDGATSGELQLDLSRKDEPAIEMRTRYKQSYEEQYVSAYERNSMVFSNINNTVVAFDYDNPIYSNPDNYIWRT